MPFALSRLDRKTKARYAVSLVFFVFGGLVGGWLPHIPDVKKAIGATDAQLGAALLCSGLGAVLSMQLTGALIHRFGSRNVALAGGMGACMFVPPLMVHTTVLGFTVNLLILGLCYGCLDVGMNSHSVQVQALHNRPILAAIHGWFSLGGIVGGFAAAIAFHLSVSPFTHLVCGSILLALMVGVSRPFLLPSHVDKDTSGPKFIVPKGTLLLLGILCACAFVAEGGVLDWSALYLRESLRASAEFGGIVTGLCSGMMALGRFLGDRLIHRWGDRTILFGSGILLTVGMVGAVSTPSLWITLVCFSVACFGIANMVPVLFNEVGTLKGIPAGAGIAAVTTCGYGGFLLGPPFIGMVAHRISLAVALGCLSVLGLAVTGSSNRFSGRGEAPGDALG